MYGIYDNGRRYTIVSGASLTGLYAADGSYNIVLDDPTYKGVYHPCGAFRVNSNASIQQVYDPSGAYYLSTFLIPSWVVNQANLPDQAFDFTRDRSWSKANNTSSTTSSLLTVSRASVGYVNDSLGNWTAVNANLPRLSDLGLLVEESRTNSIRNNSMQGAVAGVIGSGGALPTNWTTPTTPTGLTRTVSLATINGIDTVAINFAGTAGSTAVVSISNETVGQIAASYGQTWSSSMFLQVSQDDPALTQLQLAAQGTNGASQVESNVTNVYPGRLTFQRVSNHVTLNNVATTNIRTNLVTNSIASGTPINFTIVLGWPQTENNNINSTVASAVKAADGTAGIDGTAVYALTGGTGTQATLNVTWAGGVMTVNSVASAGSYTVLPPSPATLTYVSGTATGWTGATVTLTPTNNAASAFVTSPIRTTSVAATRNADAVTLTSPPAFGAAYSMYAVWTPQAPITGLVAQTAIQLDDGTNIQRSLMRRAASTGRALAATVGGTGVNTSPVTVFAQNVQTKWAFALDATSQDFTADGVDSGQTGPRTLPNTPTVVRIGATASPLEFANGFFGYLGVWTSRVPNAQLVSVTT
jgi:hypothetical protein